MKIIALNAWRGTEKEALSQYLEKEKEDTDIFLFQEADGECDALRRTHLFLWQSITTRKYEAAYNEELCETTVIKNGIDLLAAGTFFADNPNQGSGLWTEVQYKGEKFVLCNIHGVSQPSEKRDTADRLEQTRIIIDFLKNRPGRHIIMGDFNLFPDTQSIQLFEEAGYRNLIKEFNIDTTRNELAWALWPDNKQLFADYAFVSATVSVKDFRVPKSAISDHLPLELVIA